MLALCCLGFPGVVGAATIAVTGNIPCQGRLSVAQAVQPLQISGSGRAVTLRLNGTESGAMPVVLSLRTNCGYRVTAEWLGPAENEARIGAITVRAAGGVGHLTPFALQPATNAADLKPGAPAVCVEGRAVSRGGNDLTSDNAILIEFSLQLPRSAPGSAVTFTLSWQN